MKLKIKANDMVEVIAGSEKGKKGTVIEVNPRTLKVRVQGIKMVTHHDKKEGLLKKEAFIDYSNIKLVQAAEVKKKAGKAKAAKSAKA